MKIRLISFFTLILSSISFAQISIKDLKGVWKTSNDNNLFLTADTIKFKRDDKSCLQIVWNFEREKFSSKESMMCTEPPRMRDYAYEEGIKLENTDFGQILEYYRDGNVADKYRIVELTDSPNQVLKLIRFDKFSEQKLFKYVDSLNVKFKQEGSNENTSSDPLIIVNGHIVSDREFLKELLLVETSSISYLTKEQIAEIHGKLLNGIIVIKTSEKRFKSAWKKLDKEINN